MKRVNFWMLPLLVLGGLAAPAPAQVEISWDLEHNRTILMEPIRATVRIANHTGRDMDLTPNGKARLTFDVEDQPTSMVKKTGRPLLRQAVIIPANDSREVEVNLLDAYRILKGQSYMLTPVLEFNGLRFFGSRLALEVQPGLELLRREYGMPGTDTARTVSLRLIHRDQIDRVFFRLDKPSTGFCLGVFELGQVIRFFEPRLEQDRDGQFHVLHQSGPDRFVHTVFSYDGQPNGRTFYSAEVGRLRLIRDEAGAVEVAGGTPYVEDPDHPGMLTAPAPPPSHSYRTTIGELPPKGRPAAQDRRGTRAD